MKKNCFNIVFLFLYFSIFSADGVVAQGGSTLNYQICPMVTACIVQINCPAKDQFDVRISYVNPDKGKKSIKVSCSSRSNCESCKMIDKMDGEFTVRIQCKTASDIRVDVFNNDHCGGTPCRTIILPVTFASFNAQRSDSNVLLQWETATEINNTGFAVEKNFGGKWEQLTFIKSQAPGGISSTSLKYTYVDVDATDGVTQYRLKQVDIDGKFAYSPIVAVRGKNSAKASIVFPNPVAVGKTPSIVFGDPNILYDVSLIDISGKKLRQWVGAINSIQVDGLKQGIFFLRITDPQTREETTHKIIVQ